MHRLYSILQQSLSSPANGPGNPIVKFTGMLPGKAVVLTSFIVLEALLFELPEAVSLNICIDVIPLILVLGIKNTPDCSMPVTPLLQAEGLALLL